MLRIVQSNSPMLTLPLSDLVQVNLRIRVMSLYLDYSLWFMLLDLCQRPVESVLGWIRLISFSPDFMSHPP